MPLLRVRIPLGLRLVPGIISVLWLFVLRPTLSLASAKSNSEAVLSWSRPILMWSLIALASRIRRVCPSNSQCSGMDWAAAAAGQVWPVVALQA